MTIDDQVLSLKNILTRIDEYSLYCHYLGFDPEVRETYSSPIRVEGEDKKPSFSFYNARPNLDIEFMWKDGALDISGTIVQLIMCMYGLTFTQALVKLDVDFKLGFTNTTTVTQERIRIVKKPKPKVDATIAIVSKKYFTPQAKEFWLSFGISPETLKRYNVTQLESAVINGKDCYYSQASFAYRIGEKYKIYSPFNEQFKFLNNFPGTYAEGFSQLKKKSDLLIITKSLKDIMVLHELGYEAVSPKSETTMLPKEYFKWFDTHYKQVVILFDNDMKHNGEKYPYDKKYIPTISECKDVSDYMKKFKKKETAIMLKSILM